MHVYLRYVRVSRNIRIEVQHFVDNVSVCRVVSFVSHFKVALVLTDTISENCAIIMISRLRDETIEGSL